MARKLICDRCGEEINPVQSRLMLEIGKHNGIMWDAKTVDLCVSCAFWFNKFLEDEVEIIRAEKGFQMNLREEANNDL